MDPNTKLNPMSQPSFEVIDIDGAISVDSISITSDASSINDHTATSVHIKRPVFQAKDFFQSPQNVRAHSASPSRTASTSHNSAVGEESYSPERKRTSLTTLFFKKRRKNVETELTAWTVMGRFFPIFEWLPEYSLRNDFFYDLLAGLTVLSLHIPQGLAYGRLAGLEPSNGLFVSLFPALFLAVFSRSRHASMGTYAVISIACRDLLGKFESQDLTDTDEDVQVVRRYEVFSTFQNEFVAVTPLEILTSFCLLVGLIQFIISVLRLGILVNLLSDPIISAFCAGAAVHVISSQMFSLFDIDSTAGLNEPEISFELIRSWYRLGTRLPSANLITTALSASVLISLLFVKNWLEPYLMKKFSLKSMTIPVDIIAIVVMTLSSHQLNLHTNHNVSIIKDIQAGFTSLPTIPRVDIWPPMLTTAILIAFIIYATSYSVEMIYAQKHGYELDPNEELAAIGIANIGSSFFGCFPATCSIARSAVNDKVGARSQITGIISSVGMVVFILFLTSFLHPLPKCTLACIIVVALISSVMKVTEVCKFWRISRFDGALWLLSFVSVLLLGIDTGLLVAVLIGLSFLVFRIAFPEFNLKQRVSESECYLERQQHSPCPVAQRSDVLVFDFVGPLIFLNVERFKRQFCDQILQPIQLEFHRSGHLPLAIVFDCSRISFVDNKAANVLVELRKKLRNEVDLLIAGCNRHVFETLERCALFDRFNIDECYLTVYDAIVSVRLKNGLKTISAGTSLQFSASLSQHTFPSTPSPSTLPILVSGHSPASSSTTLTPSTASTQCFKSIDAEGANECYFTKL